MASGYISDNLILPIEKMKEGSWIFIGFNSCLYHVTTRVNSNK